MKLSYDKLFVLKIFVEMTPYHVNVTSARAF